MDVSLIIPTFNEAQTLPLIIPKLAELLQKEHIKGEIIIVDDNSPDQTAQVAHTLSKQYPVQVIRRDSDRGLAKSVVEGIKKAKGNICIVMDADESHPMQVIPKMVRMIKSGEADIVVGSRNMPGGGIDDWPWYRQLISKVAGLLALGLTHLSDPTSGFMAIRKQAVNVEKWNPIGWKIVLECCVKEPQAVVKEVPFIFKGRVSGTSKMTVQEQFRYLLHLWRLYQFKYSVLIEFLVFILIGAVGMGTDLAIVWISGRLFDLPIQAAAVLGFLGAVTQNFCLNRYLNFKSQTHQAFKSAYIKFISVSLGGLGVRLLVMQGILMMNWMNPTDHYVLINFWGILAGTSINFSGSKWWIFKSNQKKPPV